EGGKTAPCGMAENSSVGPATAGSAVTNAPTRCPHRRVASVTAAIRSGTRTRRRTRSTSEERLCLVPHLFHQLRRGNRLGHRRRLPRPDLHAVIVVGFCT